MDISHLHITFQTILAFFGAVAIIGGGVKLIMEAFAPFKRMAKRQDDMEQKLANDYQRLADIDKSREQIKTILIATCKLLIQLTDHIVSGNDVDKLKLKRDELVNHIMDK